MYQNVENESHEAPVVEETYEELQKRVARLERDKSAYLSMADRLRAKISTVESYLDENWDDDIDPATEAHFIAIAEALDIDVSVTKTIELTITATVDVTAKRGYDFDSLSSYDFNVSIESNDTDFEVLDVDADVDVVSYN